MSVSKKAQKIAERILNTTPGSMAAAWNGLEEERLIVNFELNGCCCLSDLTLKDLQTLASFYLAGGRGPRSEFLDLVERVKKLEERG